MSRQHLMIVDDEEVLCRSLKIDLEDDGYAVTLFHTGEDAVEALPVDAPGVVLLDLRLPCMDGISVLKRITAHDPEIKVIMMTAYGDTQTTVEAVKLGAYDFINKPFDLFELRAIIKNAFESRILKQEVTYLRYKQKKYEKYGDLVGKSPKMQDIYSQIDVLAETHDTTVLILGESGTGKELVAEAIHYRSRRKNASFMEINCASLPENLLESELFGYEKGAFTDAKTSKKGLLELADGGTVFLDEIGEIPLTIQAKLLRFLEKKTFKRLGSGKDYTVDVRVIAATNRNLEAAISDRMFRKDLYYRLNVVSLNLPPLRERKDDILLLAGFFLDTFCREMGKPPMELADDVADIFRNHSWNGNVRELRNVVERMVIFGNTAVITRDHLAPELLKSASGSGQGYRLDDEKGNVPLPEKLADVERAIIRSTLEKTRGNKTQTAQLLGISRFSLARRIERLFKE